MERPSSHHSFTGWKNSTRHVSSPDLCSSRRTALLLSSPSPSLSELLSDTCRRSFCRWCKMKARRRLYRLKMGGLDSVCSLDGRTWIQSDHVVHWRFRRIMSSTAGCRNQPESRAGKPWQGRPSSQCDNTPHFHQEAGTKIRIRRDVDQKKAFVQRHESCPRCQNPSGLFGAKMETCISLKTDCATAWHPS